MDLPQNPLLTEIRDVAVSPDVVRNATIKRPIQRKKIETLRKETAAEAIADLERDGMELFGLTRGQFSLADLLEAVLDKTGPAELGISTWTAAHTDVERMMLLNKSGRVTKCRWLVDQTFVRRVPALAAQIRELFGMDAIRVTKTHAKFCTVTNAEWKVAVRSSMNLNQNPRMESFQVGHDPELCKFLSEAMDDIWRKQPRAVQFGSSTQQTLWWNQNG